MKRRRWVFVIIAAGAVLALLWWAAVWRGEPRYKGRTLTHWLAVHQKAALNSPRERESAEAIRQIGTNALPYLVARLTHHISPWRLKVVGMAVHLPSPVDGWVSKTVLGAEDLLLAADDGFTLLGAQAAPAAPELIRLLNDKETWDIAIVALQDIGEAAVPDLVTALTNRANSLRVRAGAAQVLGSVGTNSTVVPALASCLQDDAHVARQVAAALGRLQLEPSVAVPALVSAVKNSPDPVREPAIWALGQFGTNAQGAIPILTYFLADPEPRIREATTNALEAIAPEVFGTNSVPVTE